MQAIRTDKLNLEPFTQRDLQFAHALFGDEENSRFLLRDHNLAGEDSIVFELELKKYEPESHNEFAYTVALSSTETKIGVCVLVLDDNGCEAELGWAIHKDYWGQGFGTQTAHALLEFGFNRLNLRRIYAVCDSANTASYRVMEKNGMRREGHFIKSRPSHGDYRDELYYAILKEVWEKRL